MLRDRFTPKARASRRALVTTAITLIMPLAALVLAAPASAEPKGIFKIFNQCTVENKEVTRCLYDKTTSGELSIGTNKVPFTNPLVLQGGLVSTGNHENPSEYYLLAAKNNETLSKTELAVPGGLTGFLGCEEIKGEGLYEKLLREQCRTIYEQKMTGVTAVLELVASAKHLATFNETALSSQKGTALTLLVRIHLKNSFLG